ncbi:MAG: lytic transglycosylase domain-containing protein [Alphaproteobacteria bacterium]|nr:lytic transglycosylase domain-containing protein [Alphaproteobacteria bacterium]
MIARMTWRRTVGAVVVAAAAALTTAALSRDPQVAAAVSADAAEYVVPSSLASSDMTTLQNGVAAADAGRWTEVAALSQAANDPLVRRFLQWRLAVDENAPQSFSAAYDAWRELTDWPGRATMRERLERNALNAGLSAEALAQLLEEGGGPSTGDGKIALAQAYLTLGRADQAAALARDAWRHDRLSPQAQAVARGGFGSLLGQEDHKARVDSLLWREAYGEARALLPEIGYHDRLVAQARIALQTRPRRGLQAAVDAVPASHQDDPGLLYDRADYIIDQGRWEDAAPYTARIDSLAAPLAARDEIFRQKRAFVTRHLRAGQAERAFRLTQNHGMTSGEQFSDAEFLAGWLSLRFLNAAGRAEGHFQTLARGVSSPISVARGYYWLGRAHEAQSEAEEAQAAYRMAGRHNYTYYGQLAAQRLDPDAVIAFSDTSVIPAETRERFESRELVRALRFVAQAGDQQDFQRIAFHLDDQLTDPLELELLAALARENNYPLSAVRHGKAGVFRGVLAPNAAYPIMTLPANARQPGRPEAALVHAIIRQESEFDPRAFSRAGARGLMQLMPATARITANREGVPYSLSALMDDPDYNVVLGARHLQDLLEEWNGSYILVIASYNAGSGRGRQWIQELGDPRAGAVDPIDWVESIPFSETRNYVQRVMENLQVYRHRLSGAPAPLRLQQDLQRGG